MIFINKIYLLDCPVLNIDVCVKRLVIIDDLSSFDDQTVTLETDRQRGCWVKQGQHV